MAGFSDGRRRFLLRRRIGPPVRLVAVPFALVFLLFLLCACAESSRAQTTAISDALASPAPLLVEVVFDGDRFFDDDQLRLRVRSRPNRKVFGIPGFTWWLWLHKFGSGALGGGRVGRAFMATGEPPAFLDSTVVASDVEKLRLFYEGEGFREARVEARILQYMATDRVRIVYSISAGNPTYIRTLHYNGLDTLTTEQQFDIVSGSLFRSDLFNPDEPLTWHPAGHRYSEPQLQEEGRRLMTVLRNSGFAGVTRDSIHAVVYPVKPDSFDVTIDVKLGPRYRFGDVHFQVSGPEIVLEDRLESEIMESDQPEVEGGSVSSSFRGEHQLDFDVLTRALQFKPGDWYDRDNLVATKRRLDATGVFEFTEIVTEGLDSMIYDRTGVRRLFHRFDIRTRRRHQIRLQTFMLQRSGELADVDNELGTGLAITYNNLNLFGGGEAFQFRTTGSIAADLGGKGGFTSAQWEIGMSLAYPYLTFPVAGLDRLLNLYEARSQISISLLAARRDALRLILRGRGSARYRFELRHTRTLTSLLDLIDITVSNPDTLDGFQDIFLDDVLRSIDDPVQKAQIVEDYTRPQFNNALRYTFRSSSLDPFRRDDGYSYESSFEIGGNMGYLLDRFVFSPDSLEGSLPGLPFFRGQGSGGRMRYRQYVRFSADLRKFNRLDSRSVFAWKFILGLAHPTGDSDVIPFDRRFYSGGSSSVRAWRLRELGPGSASFSSEADSVNVESTNILGGEIKLEGSVEFRHAVIRGLFAADWVLALFVDAGNVWFGPRNPGTSKGKFHVDNFIGELGVGAGFGLRLAWDYLIVRLDVAYKVHDPVRQGEILPDDFNDPVLHFGIGHTF